MSLAAELALALGLAADAAAVALAAGLRAERGRPREAARLALVFGAFQGGMLALGWAAGERTAQLFGTIDHWVAFVLLLLVGAHMIGETLRGRRLGTARARAQGSAAGSLDTRVLLALALATSIDALAAGIGLALAEIAIARAALVVGGVTALACLASFLAARSLGERAGRTAQLAGGLVLIGIGTSILLEHFGLLG
jgi:putative Mn2+ efflux pump MntP